MSTKNIARHKPVTAHNTILPYAPERAVDESMQLTKRWLAWGVPGWLTVDLGETFWVGRWVVYPLTHAGWPQDYVVYSTDLRGSVDNPEPKTIMDSAGGRVDQQLRPPRKMRYAMLSFPRGMHCNPNLISIQDFQLFEAENPPYLTALSIENESLHPFFNPKKYSYNVDVPQSRTSIRVKPTALHSQAQIKVDGENVASGTYSQNIHLQQGDNVIPIEVTSADGQMEDTYMVHVTREGDQTAPSLNSIELRGPRSNVINYQPEFNPKHYTYRADVPNSYQSVSVTATAQESDVEIKINGRAVESGHRQEVDLHEGMNEIEIHVGHNDEASHYIMEVIREDV
ncbi:cadherin-like beta sandwich domain-containing protein [Caldalkalibacillus salinus]|uniref:cadherin-like beta sandwich domain-containing protein n=1 Tax=Caldalkalibacillus salinus TaxID=2803787 RepID=UPI001923CBA2|nr:cadherin-like beta sandwich domain-containing protein [Caldalkalibacillus salinus]